MCVSRSSHKSKPIVSRNYENTVRRCDATHFDILGCLEHGVGEFLHVVLVLFVDRLADFLVKERFGFGGLFLDLLFQLVDFVGDFGVCGLAHALFQLSQFGFQLQKQNRINTATDTSCTGAVRTV